MKNRWNAENQADKLVDRCTSLIINLTVVCPSLSIHPPASPSPSPAERLVEPEVGCHWPNSQISSHCQGSLTAKGLLISLMEGSAPDRMSVHPGGLESSFAWAKHSKHSASCVLERGTEAYEPCRSQRLQKLSRAFLESPLDTRCGVVLRVGGQGGPWKPGRGQRWRFPGAEMGLLPFLLVWAPQSCS